MTTNATNNATNNAFRKMEEHAAFKRCASFTITHPKKPDGYAVVNVAYPADGAGRLRVFVIDAFSPEGRTATEGSAGGYGYDKLAAALSGMTIDGHTLANHSGQDDTSARLLKAWHKASADKRAAVEKRASKLGYFFTNWSAGGGFRPTGADGWQSCYKTSGLDYLCALGYRIIQGI